MNRKNDIILFGTLDKLAKEEKLNNNNLQLVIRAEKPGSCKIVMDDHNILTICDDEKIFNWHVPSIRELFRGKQIPPSLEKYPDDYAPLFFAIENQAHLFFKSIRVCTDVETEEVYTKLAKKPDGPITSDLHFIIWQAAAFTLGCYEVSAMEYVAVMRRLARSARTWKIEYSSKNYFEYLNNTFV